MLTILLMLAFTVSPASAAHDRTPPTTPTDLQVTAMTAYSVSLAWNPSTDNSGNVTYTICCANVSSETFPGPASSRVYRTGLEAGRSFTLFIVAKDASGNSSKQSNTVTFTLPRDTTPPTKPVVSVTDVGPTHVSPVSDPLTVTTEASDTTDTTPPTMPGNLTDNGMSFQDGETWLFWEQSTDNVDPQSVIRYDIYANGVLDHSLIGRGNTILYGNPGVFNTYQVIAVDSAGNQSDPATLTTCAGGYGCQ